MTANKKNCLNTKVINNFTKVKPTYFIPAFLVLLLGFSIPFLTNDIENSFSQNYVNAQKEAFYYLNSLLSTFPQIQYNLTQLGDVIILFPFVAIFVYYAPKLWEIIIISSVFSLIVSAVLKKIFSIPRPAAVFDSDTFVIIGKALKSHNSLPSGHSMTSFIVISTLLLAFMPSKKWYRPFFILFMLTLGFIITFSRVGVGAHYPLDVIIGSTIGYILVVISILLKNKYLYKYPKLKNNHQNIILLIIISIWIALVIQRILIKDLFITYFALVPLLITAYLIKFKKHAQKES